ncbi:MAG: thioredoxin domain-containing protein, partial [Chitinophagaceae bacterium]
HFINIKIDREERPDLDQIYMDAVQALTGSGGWPLNVFLTPDTRPFYGGTYFPPRPMHNRSSWTQVLQAVSNAFQERRADIEGQAQQLTDYLTSSNQWVSASTPNATSAALFSADLPSKLLASLMASADREEGGFGQAPKFPQTQSIRFLLHHYHYYNNEEALQQALLSLDKMMAGGLFDHVDGGFARYATDREWKVPHFEKMLYDNALLIAVFSEAFQCTKKKSYQQVIEKTLRFLENNWLTPSGGYCSSYDADSEGQEGKYYVWPKAEIEELLGEDASDFCAYFGLTEEGNWEGTNILQLQASPESFAKRKGISLHQVEEKMEGSLQKLRKARQQRTPPLLDDKILLGWNALLCTAYARAYAALGRETYRQRGVELMEQLFRLFVTNEQTFHCFRNGVLKGPAFLDDHAYLIEALIQLQEITGDLSCLHRARSLMEKVVHEFSDEQELYFYFTGRSQQDVLLRKKESYDGATPSGNAVMAYNLYYLGRVFGKSEWEERSIRMISGLLPVVEKYPGSFGYWSVVAQGITVGIPEIALLGNSVQGPLKELVSELIPLKIVQSSGVANEDYPLLSGKKPLPQALFFLCQHYACQAPVTRIADLLQQLKKVKR